MSPLALQILICLASAHLLGDFLLQSDRIAGEKHRLGALFQHSLLHAGLAYVLCGAWRSWLVPLAVFVAHASIDAIKARAGSRSLRSFLLDQVAHAASLVAIAALVAETRPLLFGLTLWGSRFLDGLILASGVVLTVFAGGVVVGLAVRPLQREIGSFEARGLKGGGRIIGQLERALILLFVLTAQPSSIGFLIAAKSIFRFGELKETKNRMEAEYILIGTMLSFGFALLSAYSTKALLGYSW